MGTRGGRGWVGSLRVLLLATIAVPAWATATTTLITFDDAGLVDGVYDRTSYVTNQFAGLGVSFTSAIALVSDIGLNAEEAPPRSASTVLSAASLLNAVYQDDPSLPQFGPFTARFSGPLPTAVGAYFTYEAPVHVSFFDADGFLLGEVDGGFASNLLSSSINAPNEFLEFRSSGGIGALRIDGSGFFVLDDLTFTRESLNSVPEPSSLALFALGLAGLCRRCCCGRQSG